MTGGRSSDADLSTAAVAARLAAVATSVGARVVELGDDIWRRILDTVPELRADDLVVELLRASVAENVARLLHRFQHRFPLESVEAPAAAIEYARRLAQRGIAVVALVRAYRIGHARYLTWCMRELDRQESHPLIFSAANHLMLDLSFEYIDQVSEQVVEAYQNERDRWLLTQTAVRAARVENLLDDGDHDLDAAESALGYRLRQHHLALLLWTPAPTNGAGLVRLDRLVAAIGLELDSVGRPLFVPRDESLAWAWIPLGARGEPVLDDLAAVVEATDPAARVAVGEVDRGLDGFRNSHRHALGAQAVALAARPGRRVTTSTEVGPLALMCHDVARLRDWVRSVLGELSVDDDPHLRLRDTVHEFLATGGSYAVTATHLTVHKNTVQYRLRKVEELLGYAVGAGHGELDLAIRACRHLGRAVMTTATTG